MIFMCLKPRFNYWNVKQMDSEYQQNSGQLNGCWSLVFPSDYMEKKGRVGKIREKRKCMRVHAEGKMARSSVKKKKSTK